jgi:hypothetical protein
LNSIQQKSMGFDPFIKQTQFNMLINYACPQGNWFEQQKRKRKNEGKIDDRFDDRTLIAVKV